MLKKGQTPTQAGFEAHSQNKKRMENPFVDMAKKWDDGWCQREEQRQLHTLDIQRIPTFSEFHYGTRDKVSE